MDKVFSTSDHLIWVRFPSWGYPAIHPPSCTVTRSQAPASPWHIPGKMAKGWVCHKDAKRGGDPGSVCSRSPKKPVRISTIFFVWSFFFSEKKTSDSLVFKDCVCFFWFLTHFISGRLAYKNSLFYVMDFFNGHRRFGGQEIETPKNYLQYLFCLPGSCQKCQPQWPLWDFFFLDFSLGLLGSMVIGSMGYFTEKLING